MTNTLFCIRRCNNCRFACVCAFMCVTIRMNVFIGCIIVCVYLKALMIHLNFALCDSSKERKLQNAWCDDCPVKSQNW